MLRSAPRRRVAPVPEQKSLLGSAVYLQPPLLTGDDENPAFQAEVSAKHDGAGGVTWVTLLKPDGIVRLNP